MLKRHNLLFTATADQITLDMPVSDRELQKALGVQIPGIVKRQNEKDSTVIEVGFSTWYYRDDNRLRLSGTIAKAAVTRVCTPFDIAKEIISSKAISTMENPLLLTGFREAALQAEQYGFEAGIFGSAALAWVTQKSYCRQGSDLDLYLRKRSNCADFQGFYNCLQKLEADTGILMDAEFEYSDKDGLFGVKLKELCRKQRTVLGKGLYSIEMFPIERVWD